ncbi:1060_t:CDS:2 [Funneliformis caledonium]|uniref:1060_t:CDS:1 n=1 Tax=Funneliformis caledonium TaxID=1117310 RepID=A0A9N9CSJ0_9GLOM|nr:1060_t:CDS:2 [Funneliformis caledonium]
MSNFTSPIFTDINSLPFTSNEKAELRVFFTNRDSTIVENVLSTITEVEEKADYLRIYFKSTRDEHQGKPMRHAP